ncbi:MAG: ParB N-terminal domain-containing protein [Pseudomonadota bacterium]|nr:ParB N-terminal domain-containing protein [Pseudomonadota bacterium]
MENVQRLDLHALIPRFASLRLRDPSRLRRLVASIEQQGQLMPVVAVPEAAKEGHWVLIDGYRRFQALERLGQDRIWTDVWERSVDEALLGCLARGPDRAWEAIEEAALIAELAKRHSLQAIAGQLGRDVSWVSRRLSLIKALPEDLLEQVRAGRISLWAATRILAPLARANAEHARTLLAQLEHQRLSTRELKRLFSHYQQANKRQRERLVENPALFLRAVENRAQESADKHLAAGPEGAWSKDLTVVGAILKRLIGQVPILFAPKQDPTECERLRQAFTSAKTQFQRLERALAEVAGDDR